MLLAHRIRLDPTPVQRDYFARAAGTARRVWNRALAQWQRQVAAGQRPNAMALKKRFNAVKDAHPDWLDAEGQPWLRTSHRDAHFQVEVPGQVAHLRRGGDHRSGDAITGVDPGVIAAATLSRGEQIPAPRPLRAALRRLRIRHRRQSRKIKDAQRAAGIAGPMPNGTRLSVSANRSQGAPTLARPHARITRVRKDFMHTLTARLCRENQTVVIEDLNVRGMRTNAGLSRAIADLGFYEFRRQLQYKADRYGTTVILADRWYPSSKLCSRGGARYGELTLGERDWTCSRCGARHDRDVNAAIHLKRLATGACAARSALPVASLAATPGTAAGMGSAGGGKVTPARHEHGRPDGSGQEQNNARFRAHF